MNNGGVEHLVSQRLVLCRADELLVAQANQFEKPISSRLWHFAALDGVRCVVNVGQAIRCAIPVPMRSLGAVLHDVVARTAQQV